MRFFLTFICLLFIKTAVCQNYQVLNSDRLYLMYSDDLPSGIYNYNNVFGVKADSFKIVQNDTIFYPYLQFTNLDVDCYIPFGPSPLGYQIISKANGYEQLINIDYDTISIRRNAQLNESWLAFNAIDSVNIYATISNHFIKDIAGEMDSVKEITFTSISNNDTLYNYLPNNTVQLSKHFGFVESLFFRQFPNDQSTLKFLSCDNPSIGPQLINSFMQNNFSVGTEFHSLSTSLDILNCDSIVDRKVSTTYIDRQNYGKDSIVYTRFFRILTTKLNANPDNIFDSLIYIYSEDTSKYTVNFYYPGRLPMQSDYYFTYDFDDQAVINYTSDYRFTDQLMMKNRASVDSYCKWDSTHCFVYNNGCLFDGSETIYVYFECNQPILLYEPYPWQDNELWNPCGYRYSPIYASSPCNGNYGTPLDFSIPVIEPPIIEINEPLPEDYLIYESSPDVISLFAPENSSSIEFELYNLLGELILTKQIESAQFETINLIENIARNIYIGVIKNNDEVLFTKKLYF